MRRLIAVSIALAIASAACGSSSADNCSDYAAEVRFQMEHAENPDDLMDWLQDTSEHAAKLIQADPDRAQPCADAIIEATFSAGIMEFEAELDSLLNQ